MYSYNAVAIRAMISTKFNPPRIVIFAILFSPLYPVYFQAVIRFPEFFNVSFDQDIPLKPETLQTGSVYSRRNTLTEKCTRQLRGW